MGLFDGKRSFSLEHHPSTITHAGDSGAPQWKLGYGYVEAVPHTGDLATKEKFGGIQFHVERASPYRPTGTSQARGNSGVLLMGRYEVQVLDAWENPTYADGQAAAIYGQYSPLANPAKRPGEWDTYDIVLETPRMDGDKLLKAAIITVLYNEVLVQNHKESMGPMIYRRVKTRSFSRITTVRFFGNIRVRRVNASQ